VASLLTWGCPPTDPLDRLVRRTDKGVVTQFAYRGLGDVPFAVFNGADNLVQQFVYLPGGVSVTLDATATSRTWSFPNLHGHVTATGNDNGDRLTSVVYDPWGVALNPAPNNVSGTANLAGFGGNGRLTESTTTKPVTHMGARPYTASTARFLTVDPIHGGCANHYVYGFGDPLNAQDLTGKSGLPKCAGTHSLYYGDVHIRLGSTQSGALQIGVSYTPNPHQGPNAQLIFLGASWSLHAPSIGLNLWETDPSLWLSELQVGVPGARLGPGTGARLDVRIQYSFWGFASNQLAPDHLIETAGSPVLEVSCTL